MEIDADRQLQLHDEHFLNLIMVLEEVDDGTDGRLSLFISLFFITIEFVVDNVE